jgi:hypothetical protein
MLATVLLLTQTLYDIVFLLDQQFGIVLPNSLTPVTEVFFQWKLFWFKSSLPIPSIPIPAISYPAVFTAIYTFCGNPIKPPAPQTTSVPLIILMTALVGLHIWFGNSAMFK